MDRLAQLLADCRAHPDDDAPRLVWADAIGGERGELVVLQCELAHPGLSLARHRALRTREAELIGQHGRAWCGLEGIAARCQFRRGFIEAATLDGAVPLAALLDRAPLARTVCYELRERTEIDALFGSPELRQIEALYVGVAGRRPASAIIHPLGLRPRGLGGIVDDHLDDARYLDRLRAFGSGSIDAERLAGTALLERLERLHIPGVRMTRMVAAELFAHAPALRALKLGTHDEIITDLVPAGIVELTIDFSDEHELVALARSRAAASIERLSLDGVANGELRALEGFPRLRSLDLEHFDLVGREGSRRATLAAFARLALAPSLRELSMSWMTGGDAGFTAIASAFGPLLELFEYPANYPPGAALAHLVAGATLVNTPDIGRRLPIEAGVALDEPWLARSVVELTA